MTSWQFAGASEWKVLTLTEMGAMQEDWVQGSGRAEVVCSTLDM